VEGRCNVEKLHLAREIKVESSRGTGQELWLAGQLDRNVTLVKGLKACGQISLIQVIQLGTMKLFSKGKDLLHVSGICIDVRGLVALKTALGTGSQKIKARQLYKNERHQRLTHHGNAPTTNHLPRI
jgi:hypothetical protein